MKRILMVLVVAAVGTLGVLACGGSKPATDPSAMGAPSTTTTDTSTMPSTPSTDTAAPTASAPTP